MTDETSGFSRREFLRRGGIALAGAALAPSLVAAQESRAQETKAMGSSKKIRMGVVGGGFGAAFHWHQDPNSVVEAVSDLRTIGASA